MDRKKETILLDALLKVAVHEEIENEMAALPSNEELNATHIPSPTLDRRINRIIKSFHRRYMLKRLVLSWSKVAACVVLFLAVSFSILMSVQATRIKILNTIVEWHEKSIGIRFEDSNTDSQSNFMPAYIPKGFTKVSGIESGDTYVIIYTNKNGIEILFTQRKAETTSISADSEYLGYQEIEIGGNLGYLLEAEEIGQPSVLAWQADTNLFTLTSPISSDELIRIGESLQK